MAQQQQFAAIPSLTFGNSRGNAFSLAQSLIRRDTNQSAANERCALEPPMPLKVSEVIGHLDSQRMKPDCSA